MNPPSRQRAPGLSEQDAPADFAAAALPGQAQIARDLGLPLSTFRRRLRQGGSSYRVLREAALRSAACEALSGPGRRIGDIAASLGFADSGTFRRAFVQWFGMTPGAWRARAIAAGESKH